LGQNCEIWHSGQKNGIHNFGWDLDKKIKWVNGQLIAGKMVKIFHIQWLYHNVFTVCLKE